MGEDSLCAVTYFKNEHEIVSVGNECIFQTCYHWLCYWLALPKEFSWFSQSCPVVARTHIHGKLFLSQMT